MRTASTAVNTCVHEQLERACLTEWHLDISEKIHASRFVQIETCQNTVLRERQSVLGVENTTF